MIFSEDIGYRKSDERIYLHTLDKIGSEQCRDAHLLDKSSKRCARGEKYRT
ncbi:MAG: hypothetical protein R6U17_00540 [Thermoplasmata archaeon]